MKFSGSWIRSHGTRNSYVAKMGSWSGLWMLVFVAVGPRWRDVFAKFNLLAMGTWRCETGGNLADSTTSIYQHHSSSVRARGPDWQNFSVAMACCRITDWRTRGVRCFYTTLAREQTWRWCYEEPIREWAAGWFTNESASWIRLLGSWITRWFLYGQRLQGNSWIWAACSSLIQNMNSK